jgi:hypothetical protein
MSSDWYNTPGEVTLSPYLLDLYNSWSAANFPGIKASWLAVAGTYCTTKYTRSYNGYTNGCSANDILNDSFVCAESVLYQVKTPAATVPTQVWADPSHTYVHTTSLDLILAGLLSDGPLCDPLGGIPLNQPGDDLLPIIVNFINSTHP